MASTAPSICGSGRASATSNPATTAIPSTASLAKRGTMPVVIAASPAASAAA